MQAALLGLLQRFGTQTKREQTAGMVFFDEGHTEYAQLYRKSQAYMPVGSNRGGWADGASANKPLGRFIEDGNQKRSDGSFFLQVADMVAYAALTKLKAEAGKLSTKRLALGHDKLFDQIPKTSLNLKATTKRNDGIVKI